jgi:hypothetical protein
MLLAFTQLLADSNDEINKWLGENPAILGGIFLVLGLVLLGFGVTAIVTGRSTGKYGHKMEGPMAHLHGAIMAIAGAGFSLFAIYKLISAVL